MFGKRKSKQPPGQISQPGPESPVLPPGLQNYTASAAGVMAVSVSLIGGRKSQQDVLDYRILSHGEFGASVCDGMGGLNGGARAALEACTGFFEEYESAVLSGSGAAGFPRIAQRLDQRVRNLHDTDGLPLDGGSTLTAVIIQNGVFHWLSVGDSRIGLLRNGQMYWLNRLHNYRLELDEALQNGDISATEYQAELPRGQALLSYLGCGDLKYIDYQTGQALFPSDILLLCSDGFYDLLPGEALISTLEALDDVMTNLPELLEPSLGQAGRSMDNASAIVIRCL